MTLYLIRERGTDDYLGDTLTLHNGTREFRWTTAFPQLVSSDQLTDTLTQLLSHNPDYRQSLEILNLSTMTIGSVSDYLFDGTPVDMTTEQWDAMEAFQAAFNIDDADFRYLVNFAASEVASLYNNPRLVGVLKRIDNLVNPNGRPSDPPGYEGDNPDAVYTAPNE